MTNSAGINGEETPTKPYSVTVSLRFIFVSLLTSFILAFAVGTAARVILVEGPIKALCSDGESPMRVHPDYHEHLERKPLPTPVLQDGKEMPQTIYTAKNFDTGLSTATSLLIAKEFNNDDKDWTITSESGTCGAGADGSCSRGKRIQSESESEPVPTNANETDDDEEEHLPAGQHLLVDIKDVDATFLNSEERLAQAMIDVVNDSRLTLLSYHCHKLEPSGISCAGVLLESHVSFHTWPEEGVITLDLFTCGAQPLLPVVPIIRRLFEIPHADGKGNMPSSLWAHKQRGFRNIVKRLGHLDSWDLGRNILGILDFDMKQEIATAQTPFQRIDIYDLIFPRFNDLESYERSLSNDGSYESKHPELYKPDRQVFLDGILQSSSFGDEAYHEGLIHPAMLTHPNPKRVAIIGGGEGASLREVLKYKSLEKVAMIEIDEMMVDVSKEFIPTWNTCDNIQGSVKSCFEDPRTEMYYEDALAWFIDRYIDGGDGEEKFDVIIMDALDPRDNVEFADALYNNDVFLRALYQALSDDGIIVMQLGEAPGFDSPSEDISVDKNRATIIGLMEYHDFESFHVYEEFHSGFLSPWVNLVACKDVECRKGWHRNEAEIELAMRKKLLSTVSGAPILQYFDGATMMTYQVPHKVFETVYCRKTPTPESCDTLGSPLLVKYDVTWHDFEVKESTLDGAGLGLFTTVDILKGSSLYFDDSPIMFPPSSLDVMAKAKGNVEDILAYISLYGEENNHLGETEYTSDSSVAKFANHGCDGTNNVIRMFDEDDEDEDEDADNIYDGEKINESKMNLKEVLKSMKPTEYGYQYNPLLDRRLKHYNAEVFFASRNIKAGEEITIDYLSPKKLCA